MIKTFTLRLTDLEAEALERLARVNGVSKNKQLEIFIAREYIKIDPISFVTLNELQSIAATEDGFLMGLKEGLENMASSDDAKEQAGRCIRQIDYMQENTTDEKILNKLDNERYNIIDYINENCD